MLYEGHLKVCEQVDEKTLDRMELLMLTAAELTDKVFGCDWSLIQKFPAFKLSEAVALSVDLDPFFADIGFALAVLMCGKGESPFDNSDKELVLSLAGKILAGRFGESKLKILQSFVVRYAITVENVQPFGDLPVIEKNDPPSDSKVRLTEFATWAQQSQGWDLPEGFPKNSLSNKKASSADQLADSGKRNYADATQWMSKQQIAETFAGIYWERSQWLKYLSSTPNWLKDCRESAGRRGCNSQSAKWNPRKIAHKLLTDKNVAQETLDNLFKTTLKAWQDEWRDFTYR